MTDDKKGPNLITVVEGRPAPTGYAYKHKRLMKNCKSCRWWQAHTDSRFQITAPKKKRRACTQRPQDDQGRHMYDPGSGVKLKGEHFGKRTDPLFSCENFFGKSLPLIKLKDEVA